MATSQQEIGQAAARHGPRYGAGDGGVSSPGRAAARPLTGGPIMNTIRRTAHRTASPACDPRLGPTEREGCGMRRFVTAWFTAVVVLVGGAGLLAPTATAAPLAPTATAASLRDDPGTAAARAALVRLAPHLQQRFVLHHSVAAGAAGGAFTISRERGHVALSGSSNVALVSAFSWYLENVANGQIARGPDHIPTYAPLPQATIHKTSPFQYRYLNNFTVRGYTT